MSGSCDAGRVSALCIVEIWELERHTRPSMERLSISDPRSDLYVRLIHIIYQRMFPVAHRWATQRPGWIAIAFFGTVSEVQDLDEVLSVNA